MATQTSVAVVAEKPSVARDIARVLNATKRGEGYLHGDGYVVTWAIGHLVALAQPHEISPQWRSWRRDLLPMLPESWPLVVGEKTKDQFEVVRKILSSPKVGTVVCATDAGREGELIFRYIYEAAGCDKPVQRLWISSLTPEAIRDGFAQLKDSREYDPLADAARGRSRADWLVGMNLSRAYTLGVQRRVLRRPRADSDARDDRRARARHPQLRSGRLSERRRDVLATRRRQVHRHVVSPGRRADGCGGEACRRTAKKRKPSANVSAPVRRTSKRSKRRRKRMSPPLFYDLTELQRHANRLYSFSAQRTLELAQALYERHKLISYPRTDSRHLSQDVARTLPKIVKAIAGAYEGLLAPGTGERPLGRRFVDDAKVSDHHAIIPTGVSPANASLDPDERKLFDLICRRLLSAWHDDHIWSVTTVITLVRSSVEDRFHSSGTAVVQVGWKVLDIASCEEGKGKGRGRATARRKDRSCLPILQQGQPQEVRGCRVDCQEDAGAEALHRRHAADRDGDGGQDARR